MEKALRECLAIARRICPDRDDPLVATSLNNLVSPLTKPAMNSTGRVCWR
jgi:hypothetical protein